MLRNISFILLFTLLARSSSNEIIETARAYETDYTKFEVIKLIKQGVKLSFGKLFKGNDTYGPINEEVTFWCINRQTNQIIQTFVNDPQLNLKIDSTKPLYIVVHGWLDNVNRTWVKDTVRDLIVFFDVNVCAVNWSKLANYEYIDTTQHVYVVGEYVAAFVDALVQFGVNIEFVNLVGTGLGAHISGHVGLNLKGQIGVIYGLDPAGIFFCGPIPFDQDQRLDSSDARFVQVIHTTDNYFGCSTDSGDQDFRPDAGIVPQAACLKPKLTSSLSPEMITCSHLQAVQYFRYSLNVTNVYEGKRCNGAALYDLQFCNRNPTDRLGPHSERMGGRFYLDTRFLPPYTPREGLFFN